MTNKAKPSSHLSDPSLMLAVPATVIYYVVMFLPGVKDGILYRYTTQHAVEYVIVFMFMWGMIDVLLKLAGFPKESWALRRDWIPPRTGRVPISQAAEMLERIQSQPRRSLNTRIGQRLLHALTFVVENQSAEELPDHLRYLADEDEDTTFHRYSLIRFVVAVTPILGFLGTVVHFGTALSGLSLANIETGLEHVVSEMGTAFNTTTVALAAAMTTMFSMFLCERIENGIIRRINRFTERELVNRFEVKQANLVPLMSTFDGALREFQSAIQHSLQDQIALWSTALQAMFQQFDARQKDEQQHWQAVCDALRNQHQVYDEARDESLKQLLKVADSHQEQQLAQIRTVLERASGFSGEVGALAKTLQTIARGEGRLADLQTTLTENLRVLHEAHQIDAALHGLTAAIHLLTSRSQTVPFNNAA